MEINLIKNSIIVYNTSIGNRSFDFYTTTSLLWSLRTFDAVLNDGDVVCIESDLLDRIYCGKFKYYFESSFDRNTVASGIVFSCKNYDFEDYVTIDTNVGEDFYYAVFSGEYAYPRYLRITHSLSAVSGTLYGVYVTNNEDVVDFGADGSLLSENIFSERGKEYIKEIKIYNNNNSIANANVQIEPKNTYMDDYIFISESDSGPWRCVNEKDLVIATTGIWSKGTIGTGLVVADGTLMLAGESTTGTWASNIEEATYTTRIFNFDSNYYSTLFIDMYNADLGCRVAEYDSDVSTTIEVASLPKPKDYYVYISVIRTYTGSYTNNFWIRLNSVETKDFIMDLDYVLYNYGAYSNNSYAIADYVVHVNRNGAIASFFTDGCVVRLSAIDSHFSGLFSISLLYYSDLGVECSVKSIEVDINNGVWIYLYCNKSVSTAHINSDYAHTLMHFNSNGDRTLRLSSSSEDIHNVSVVPGGTDVWYTAKITCAVYRVNTLGVVMRAFYDTETTSDLRGCCSLDDWGCWFINGNDVHRLNSSGSIIKSIYGVSNTLEMSEILVHDDGSLFIIDGDYVKRVSTNEDSLGFIHFNVILAGARRLIYDEEGIWVYLVDRTSVLLSEDSGSIVRTIGTSDSVDRVRVMGIFRKKIDDIDFNSLFPIATDPLWPPENFYKKHVDEFCFQKPFYHQIKLTLRNNKPFNIYNVPQSINEWNVDDDFNNEVGYEKPYDHRWSYHSDTYIDNINETVTAGSNIININKKCCVFPGYWDVSADVYQYIDSKGKYYIKDVNNAGDYDIMFDYFVPNINDVDFRINMFVTPFYDYLNSREAIYIRRESGVIYIGYYLRGGRSGANIYTYSQEQNITSVFLKYGRLRISRAGLNTYFYYYSFVNNTWVLVLSLNRSTIAGTSFVINFNNCTEFYLRIDCKSTKPIYILQFTRTNADVYWYYNTPKIKGLYLRDYITVESIYPNNYKSVYIKTEVPLSELEYKQGVSHDYKLKAWWELQL